MEKLFVGCQGFLDDSFRLGKKIYDSGYRPDFLIAIWRGGTPVGIAVQEFLAYKGIKTDHIAIRTSAYGGIGRMRKQIKVHNLGYLLENIDPTKKLLIVDDVFDTGRSMETLIKEINTRAGDREPEEIRVAVVYYKQGNNETSITPDYFVHKTNKWIVFPHELVGLTEEEISKKGGAIAKILSE